MNKIPFIFLLVCATSHAGDTLPIVGQDSCGIPVPYFFGVRMPVRSSNNLMVSILRDKYDEEKTPSTKAFVLIEIDKGRICEDRRIKIAGRILSVEKINPLELKKNDIVPEIDCQASNVKNAEDHFIGIVNLRKETIKDFSMPSRAWRINKKNKKFEVVDPRQVLCYIGTE